MSYKGLSVLKAYLKEFLPETIDCVVAAQDKNVEEDYYEQIKEVCLKNRIQFYNKNEKYKINSEYSFSISWKWILKTGSKLIVCHDSLLPKYRGFAPIVNALINGEEKIGTTALFAKEAYDRGEIIMQNELFLKYPITIKQVVEIISDCYINMVLSISRKILAGMPISSYAQDESKASYSLWRNEEDYKINWDRDSSYIKRFIDSVGFPYKGAKSKVGDHFVRILEANIMDDVDIVNRHPGKVIFLLHGCPVVVCGKGLLKITKMVDAISGKDLLPINQLRIKFL